MDDRAPLLSADEVFAVNKNLRWVALTTASGEVLLNEVRPGVASYSPREYDENFVRLGPLTMLGVAEKYTDYVSGVDCVVVFFGLVIGVYTRLGSQVLSVTMEKDMQALSQYLEWLRKKKTSL